MNFEELMAYAKKTDCSDIHITVGTNLALRLTVLWKSFRIVPRPKSPAT